MSILMALSGDIHPPILEIHVDHAHNFGLTLRNGKTMFTWPGTRSDLVGMRFPDDEPFNSGKDKLLNDDLLSVASSLARWGAL
ncbi:hypothetical protein [Ralstonia pseudosolanacearum]|uniref:hypothetical protein n=1 Tax=Ralstonia pseudosolanacearum TaxID=1310165 RepID=UPI0020C80E03|nr:hypothetical protein [Ralstonia pseudosolanacearum]